MAAACPDVDAGATAPLDEDAGTPTDAPTGVSADAAVQGDRLLAVNDIALITCYGFEDLETWQRIGPAGSVRLPLLGDVPLVGKTAQQAAAELETRYRTGGFILDPHVAVFVVSSVPDAGRGASGSR